jgi:hypothetical protein
MTTSETTVKIPGHHGQAHQELSDTPCAFNHGWRGCNLIDVAKKAVGLQGEQSHQQALVDAAREAGSKACATCLLPLWAAEQITINGQEQ